MESTPTEFIRLVLPQDSEIERLSNIVRSFESKTTDLMAHATTSATQKADPAPLRERIFNTCAQLKTFLDKHGKQPDAYLIPIHDKLEYVRQYKETVQPWIDKFQADYLLNFRDKVIALRHELALVPLTDDTLDKKLGEGDSSHVNDETVKAISDRLRYLAAQLD